MYILYIHIYIYTYPIIFIFIAPHSAVSANNQTPSAPSSPLYVPPLKNLARCGVHKCLPDAVDRQCTSRFFVSHGVIGKINCEIVEPPRHHKNLQTMQADTARDLEFV